MLPKASDFAAGVPLSAFTAAVYGEILKRLDARSGRAVMPPLYSPEAGTIGIAFDDGFYATLSGSASPYSWAEAQGVAGGTWQPRVTSGTSNGYEVNGVAGLGGDTVWMTPGYPGDYRFQYVTAGGGGGGGGGGGTVAIPGCPCTSFPTTLNLTVNSACDPDNYNNATLIYGPTPAAFVGTILTPNCFMSTASFFNSGLGLTYFYTIQCSGSSGEILLVQAYPADPTMGTTAFLNGIGGWAPPVSPNSCKPFRMTLFDYSGGLNPLCQPSLIG